MDATEKTAHVSNDGNLESLAMNQNVTEMEKFDEAGSSKAESNGNNINQYQIKLFS